MNRVFSAGLSGAMPSRPAPPVRQAEQEAPPVKPDWYVLWVETGREEETARRLRALEHPLETLCPAQALWRRRGGEWTLKRQLIFPGYVFLRCRMDPGVYCAVKALRGVLGWLGCDSPWPTTVRQEEMDVVLALAGGADPGAVLANPRPDRRQRRGYGTLTIHGKTYRVPYNVYKEPNNQAEAPPGDASPEDGPKPITT